MITVTTQPGMLRIPRRSIENGSHTKRGSASKGGYYFWTAFGQVSDCFWTAFGLLSDRFWTTFGMVFGPVSDCFWTSFGLLLDRFWTGFGLPLDHFWTGFGLLLDWFLDRFRTGFGLVAVITITTQPGMLRVTCRSIENGSHTKRGSASKGGYYFWTAFGQVSDCFWTAFGPLLDQFWNGFWTSFGLLLE